MSMSRDGASSGGEEFLILLPDTGLDAAKLVAENVRRALAAITIPSIERAITASVGVAVLPDHAGDATSLLRHADRALYTAKKNGRNRTELFTSEMVQRAHHRPGARWPPSTPTALPRARRLRHPARPRKEAKPSRST
jgi:predicted signal transduction protein with EAL and GGDEF domain